MMKKSIFAACLTVCAMGTVTAYGVTYTSASYVQDGLVAQWDAIDNAGVGMHVNDSKIWKDLTGNGRDLTLIGKGAWTNGLALKVSGASAKGSSAAPTYRTIEVVYKMQSGNIMFYSGINNKHYVLFTTDGGKGYFEGSVNTPYVALTLDPTAMHTISGTYNGSGSVDGVYRDGVSANAGTYKETWSAGDSVIMVGDRSAGGTNYKWSGEVHAIRLYSVVLTPEQIASNSVVDVARFSVPPTRLITKLRIAKNSNCVTASYDAGRTGDSHALRFLWNTTGTDHVTDFAAWPNNDKIADIADDATNSTFAPPPSLLSANSFCCRALLTTQDGTPVSISPPVSKLDFDTNICYTVTVDGGTRTAPVSLDDLNVTVSRPGEELLVVPFSQVYGEFAAEPAIFRKRGSGWMMSSTKMATFTGEIRIEEGAFMVNTNLMTGPQSTATAPTVVISNGASFALAATTATCAGNTLRLYNHFHLQGTGIDNLGVIANLLSGNQCYCFNNDWTLDGDVLLCGDSSSRFDMIDRRTIYMNGHTLTMRKGKGSKWWSFCPGSSRFIGGHIIVDGMTFNPQSSWASGWQTGAENTLTITNGSQLSYYNSYLTIPWTLIMQGGTLFSIGGGDTARSDYGHTDNGAGQWSGPLRANGSIRIAGSAAYKGLVLKGPLSGPGPVNVGSGWLQLLADSPDYLGKINVLQKDKDYAVRDSGLGLYKPNALNPNGAGVTLTNAALRLATDEAYKLPPITAYVSAGTNYTFDGGNGASMYSSLVKTGEGRLDIDTPMSVTGRLELAGGTLRMAPAALSEAQFYSLNGGLWKAVVSQADGAAAYIDAKAYYSNDVVTCCDWMKTPTYPPWVQYATVSWGGYVWNRSDTNETWRFALGVSGYSRFWVDGTKIMSTDDNGLVAFYNKTMTPGPHSFLLKVNPRAYGHPGSVGSPRNKNWKVGNMGIAVSTTSTTSTNSDDFVFMEDVDPSAWHPGGNGYWFTRDTRDVGDFSAEALETARNFGRHLVSNAVCHAGTLLDLGEGNEVPMYVPRFEGVTTVTNGGLTVAESWTLRSELLGAMPFGDGGRLTVHGPLKFGEDATLGWDGLSLLPRGGYVIAMATGGIDGLPKWAPADLPSSRWRLAKAQDADGNDILTFTWAVGTTVIVR